MTSRTRAATLTAAYYAAIFAALGAHLPYWPLWLEHWGLSRSEIGWYLGIATAARIIGTTVIPAVADRFAVRRWTIVLTALATVAAHIGHLLVETSAQLMAITLLAAVVMAPAVPVGEGLGLRASERHGFPYAPVRAAGSFGFLLANIVVGAYLGRLGPDLVLWIVVIGFALVALLGAVHPGGGAPPGAGSDRAGTGEVLRLFLTPAFLVFAFAAVIGQASHVVYYVYSALDWRAQGIPDHVIGWLWATGVIAETALMLGPGRRWLLRIGPAHALSLGGAAAIVRWIALAFEPALFWLWPLQALHALSFGLAHLGAMAFLAAALPGRMIASAQGLTSGALGGGLGALVVLGAAGIVDAGAIAEAYWLAAGMALISVVLSMAFGRVWSGERLVDDKNARGHDAD